MYSLLPEPIGLSIRHFNNIPQTRSTTCFPRFVKIILTVASISSRNKRRSDNDVDEREFYRYAEKWTIEAFEEYMLEWKISHMSAGENEGSWEVWGN